MRFSESSNQINQDIYNENRPLTKLPSNYCFDGIDLIKFICAFLVCIIHISPLPTESLLYSNYINFGFQQYICRIAVPFYFMASGFFLFRKIDLTNIDTNRIQKYCFKTLRLLGTWTLLLVVGWTGHLWYLGALVVAVVLISVLLKYHIKFKYIALLSILLYIIGLLGDSYHGIIEPLKNINIFSFIFSGYEYFFSTTRNGVFMGFIFVLMGVLFAHNKILLNLKSAVLCFCISMLLLLVEVFVLQYFSNPKDHNMYISLIPATFFLFTLQHI
ncbi:MAG: acyltransferase family protein [Ruminococcus sp.]